MLSITACKRQLDSNPEHYVRESQTRTTPPHALPRTSDVYYEAEVKSKRFEHFLITIIDLFPKKELHVRGVQKNQKLCVD